MTVNTLTRKTPYKTKTIRKISIASFLKRYRKGICSAEPVIKGFKISVDEIFAKI